MAESHVISALIDKRAELLGLIEHHRSHIQNLSISIDQLDASILLFDHDYDFKKAKSKAIRHINPWFKQGEVPRLLIGIIKDSLEPISTTQLRDSLIKLKGMDIAGLKERDRLCKLVFGSLKRMSDNGQIKCTGKIKGAGGGVMLWVIA